MASVSERIREAMERLDYDTVEALLQSVPEGEPGYAAAYHDLARAYLRVGRFDEAQQHLETALAHCPSSRQYRLDLGKFYTMMGEYENAIPLLESGLGPEDGAAGAGVPSPPLPVPPRRDAGNDRAFPPEEPGEGAV